jgi:iron complex outermembrane receptor protein
VEADLTVKPVSNLTMNFSYAYTYTDIPLVPVTYTQFSSTGTPLYSTTVNQKFYIVFTPRNAASASIDYDLPEVLGGARPSCTSTPTMHRRRRASTSSRPRLTSSFVVNARLLAPRHQGWRQQDEPGSVEPQRVQQPVRLPPRSVEQPSGCADRSGPAGTNVVVIGNNGNVLGDYGNFNMPRTFGFDASIKF